MIQTAEEYVNTRIRQMLAPVRRRTVYTPAGRAVVTSPGERCILAPDGRPIRIVTDEHGNTVVSTDEIQGVVIRPGVLETQVRTTMRSR